jgi:hypothetical protein
LRLPMLCRKQLRTMMRSAARICRRRRYSATVTSRVKKSRTWCAARKKVCTTCSTTLTATAAFAPTCKASI